MAIKKYFVLLLLFIATGSLAQTPAEVAVWKKVEALNAAIFVKKDSMTLVNLVDSRVTYGHSGGNIEEKQEMISKAINNKTTYKDVSTEKISITIINNTAIVRHKLNAVQTDVEGKESALHLGVLQTWIKAGKQWKLVARQAVKVAVN